jgi:hypothetical protein
MLKSTLLGLILEIDTFMQKACYLHVLQFLRLFFLLLRFVAPPFDLCVLTAFAVLLGAAPKTLYNPARTRGTIALWQLLTKLPITAGAKPPFLRLFLLLRSLRLLFLRVLRLVLRLPPCLTLGDITVVAVMGGRTQPGVGSLVIGGAVEEGWRASGLKNSAGDK